jgi:hypothetical protein
MRFCRHAKMSPASASLAIVLFAGALIASVTSGTAFAQTVPDSEPCFEIVGGQGDAGGQMLLNRCTGRSWILTRTTRNGEATFRWITIAPPRTESVASLSPPGVAAAHHAWLPLRPDGTRCFTFAARRYCE